MSLNSNFVAREQFDNGTILDKSFFLIFYLCIGFTPPIVTFIGAKALHIPFVTIAVFIGIRIFLRPIVRKRFFRTVRKPSFIFLSLFIIVLSVFAIVAINYDLNRLRVIQKPIAVFLFFIILVYVLSNNEEINVGRLHRFLLSGIFIGIFWVAFVALWGTYYFNDVLKLVDIKYSFLYINKINRALEVIAIFVFIATAGNKRRLQRLYIAILLVFSVVYLSVMNYGSLHTPKGWQFPRKGFGSFLTQEGWYFPIHIDSETVQFGLPMALIVFILALKFPKLLVDLVFLAITFILVTSPWLFQLWYWIINSLSLPIEQIFLIRAEIWDGVARKVLESPVFGYGIDSMKYLRHIDEAHTFHKNVNTLHPHNMFLQLWLDIGIAGVFIVMCLIISSWRTIRGAICSNNSSIIASITMLSLYCLVTHSVWQTWNMALISILVVIIAVTIKSESSPILSTKTTENG